MTLAQPPICCQCWPNLSSSSTRELVGGSPERVEDIRSLDWHYVNMIYWILGHSRRLCHAASNAALLPKLLYKTSRVSRCSCNSIYWSSSGVLALGAVIWQRSRNTWNNSSDINHNLCGCIIRFVKRVLISVVSTLWIRDKPANIYIIYIEIMIFTRRLTVCSDCFYPTNLTYNIIKKCQQSKLRTIPYNYCLLLASLLPRSSFPWLRIVMQPCAASSS